MREITKFYINGEWVTPRGGETRNVINPATEEPCARLSMGTEADVDAAVSAARKAFHSYSTSSIGYRCDLIKRVIEELKARSGDLADVITEEMGAPTWLSKAAQAPSAIGHFMRILDVLEDFQFEKLQGGTAIRYEPVGVVGMITPWNWPANQIACKIAPALAAGCTMILKPSEITPGSAVVIAEALHEAGVPAGVFNMVHGEGPIVGERLANHSDIDMISLTGSVRAGVAVAKAAAPSVKRVHQELGGKSPNIILPDSDLNRAVSGGVKSMMTNSGQSCNAPSRMFVRSDQYEDAMQIAAAAASKIGVAAPTEANAPAIGPISNQNQYAIVQDYIAKGVSEGAKLLAGGEGRPDGFNRGFFARPTVFGEATNEMTIAREEIFGPVLTMIPYEDVEHAIELANDTEYGLSAYVSGGDIDEVREVGRKIRAGMVHLNGAGVDNAAPFGGYKHSGNGREWGAFGFHDFLEVKAMMGFES